jgi:hypothetical protein
MPEGVVPFLQQVGHGVTGSHIGQKPEGVLQVGQQPHIGVGEGGPGAGFEMLDGLRRVATPENVEPLLHIALVVELGTGAGARGVKKGI